MLFQLKKAIGYALMPLPLCLTLMIAGGILLFFTQRTRLGKGLLTSGLLLLLLFSHSTVSVWLLRPLETRYPPIPELVAGAPLPVAFARCRYIAVLGSGHGDSDTWPATAQLSSSALARITEAVRLARLLPDAQLILAGHSTRGRTPHADVLAQAAESLGVSPARFLRVTAVRDTEDEAHAIRRLAGDGPVALVTSAAHLPRATALLRNLGIAVVPCPTDFLTKPPAPLRWNDFLFDNAALERSTWAVRERLGYAWVWLRGKT